MQLYNVDNNGILLVSVCDEHVFKDEYLFYRFRRDDDSYTCYQDLKYFYRGQMLNQRCQKYRTSICCKTTDFYVTNTHIYAR